jgi:hypothetical protein
MRRPGKNAVMDAPTLYDTGLNRLLERLGKEHPRYADVLTLQSRLLENISQTQRYGDTETRRAERAQMVHVLNQLAEEAVGVSFNELCRPQEPHASIRHIQDTGITVGLQEASPSPDPDLSDQQRRLNQRVGDPGRDKPDKGLSRTPVPWWRSRKVWVPIVVALIGLAGVIVPIVLTRCDGNGDFEYLVRVQVRGTGDYVEGAGVTIEIGGEAPLDNITDTQGLARIRIPSSHAGQPGKLIVEASGYKRYEQNISLVRGALPDVVQLEPAP